MCNRCVEGLRRAYLNYENGFAAKATPGAARSELCVLQECPVGVGQDRILDQMPGEFSG